MSRYNASKLTYEEVTVLGQSALFSECRINRATVPDGMYRYELRHGDENWGEAVELARGIMVNFYGTVLTREPFQLPIGGWLPLDDSGISYIDGGCNTLTEFQQKYPVSEKEVIDFFTVNERNLHDLYFFAKRGTGQGNRLYWSFARRLRKWQPVLYDLVAASERCAEHAGV